MITLVSMFRSIPQLSFYKINITFNISNLSTTTHQWSIREYMFSLNKTLCLRLDFVWVFGKSCKFCHRRVITDECNQNNSDKDTWKRVNKRTNCDRRKGGSTTRIWRRANRKPIGVQLNEVVDNGFEIILHLFAIWFCRSWCYEQYERVFESISKTVCERV